ncbi:MAG: ATP-binding protein, partial [Candidatus Krumholzibacteria bacterium]|nr:ATP-binding protein [Candidatus Krumholzibacteria bacterium]
MNPFKYGQVVSAEDFCPRPKLLDSIKGFIRTGQNVLIQGERRTGKTSLIHEAVRQIRRIRLLYIDLLEIKTIEDLYRRLLRGIMSLEEKNGFINKLFKSISHLKPTMTIDPATGQPSLSLDASTKLKPDSIEGLLDMIEKISRKKPIVVVLDEFQDVLNLKEAPETLAILRSKIQFHTGFSYIFAGSIRNRMDEIFNHPRSAFFKSAVTINVGAIDRERFGKFLVNKFSLGKRKINGDTSNRIFEIADYVPGDVQQLCGALWETTSKGAGITVDDIPQALNLIYTRESKGYEAMLVHVTGQQLRVLNGLATIGGKAPLSADFLRGVGVTHPSSVKKTLDRLVQTHIIFRHEGEYKFVNP